MGQLFSRAGPRARLQLSSLEDRCTPSATVINPKVVASVSINDGAAHWQSVTSIEIEFTRQVDFDPSRAVHLMKSELGGLQWTEISVANKQVSVNSSNHSVLRMIGPSAGEAIVVDGDYKIVLTPRLSAPVDLISFHGIDLGEDSSSDDPWHA